jgi:hypothetical protein
MESWRRVWREGFVPGISTPGLEALRKALVEDDPRLIQGATTSPPPLQCVEDWPVEGACAVGYCGWAEIEIGLNAEAQSVRPEGCKEIPLTKGKVAWVDADDYESLAQYSWWALEHHGRWYAYRTEYLGGGRKNEKKRNIQMHRQLLDAPKGAVVDHQDRNGLNNTRDNLVLCSDGDNKRNCKRVGASIFRGIYPSPTKGKWCARYSDGGKTVYIGTFDSERKAALAYNEAVSRRFGVRAILNRFVTVGEVEEFFARMCFACDQRLGEPAGCHWLLNWLDGTPREEMRAKMLAEVNRSLALRREV